MRRETKQVTWGSDGVVSMPAALETTDTAIAHMDGFCFTPDGLRMDLTAAEREDVLSQGYAPQGDDDGAG